MENRRVKHRGLSSPTVETIGDREQIAKNRIIFVGIKPLKAIPVGEGHLAKINLSIHVVEVYPHMGESLTQACCNRHHLFKAPGLFLLMGCGVIILTEGLQLPSCRM